MPPPRPVNRPDPLPPPASMLAVGWPALARVAQRLGLSLADVDRRMTVADVLAEVDLQRYLYDLDVDDPPFAGPAPRAAQAYASAGLARQAKARVDDQDLPLSAFARPAK